MHPSLANQFSLSALNTLVSGLLIAAACTGCGGGAGDSPTTSTTGETADTARLRTQAGVSQLALTQLQAVNLGAANAGTLIESFDDYSGVDGSIVPNWQYIPGAEFPGSSGALSLASVSGMNRVGKLDADLACNSSTIISSPSSGCGKYVGASRTFASPLSVAAPSVARIQLKLKLSHPMLTPTLRLVDEGGQVLQYTLASDSLESAAGGGWVNVSVPIKSPTNWWSGQNNGKLQGGVKGISFNASQWSLAGPRAAMQVDDIRLMPDNFIDLALTGQEALLSSTSPSPPESRLSVNARYYKISDTSARLAAEAGFKTVRVDLFWATVERNGKFDFAVFDTVLKRLEKNGLKALFILNYGHVDHGGGAPVSDEDRAAFLEYAKQATRFAAGRNVEGFEIWNEPDNATYWANGDVGSYAQLLSSTRAAIKAIDPTRVVLNGGPSWFNFPYILNLAATGSLDQIDAFAIHGYRGKTNSPEGFAADLRRLQHLLQSKGIKQPIWTTEWGTSSAGLNAAAYGAGDDSRARRWQAQMVLRKVLTQLALSVPLINLYELVDSGDDAANEEHNFGLLTSNMMAKPSYNAIKQLNNLTKGKTYAGLIRNVPSSMHGMKWTGNGTTVYAVWTDSDSTSARLTVPTNATILGWDGEAISGSLSSSGTKQVTLTSGSGPVYVVM